MKKTVAVLFGGVSSEHDVSLMSAKSVIQNIPCDKYNTILIGITKQGQWFLFDGDIALLAEDKWLNDASCVPACIAPDRGVHGIIVLSDPVRTIPIDVVFPVLHGKNGEDGSMQGLLQMAGIPFVGSGCIASGACMDKSVTNALADMAGIPQAKWVSFTQYDYYTAPSACVKQIESLQYPVFVKPACAGSSIGISKVDGSAGLSAALELAFAHDNKVVVEVCVQNSDEVECAVLGNDELVVGEVGQIEADSTFYDYEAKYEATETKLYIPAHLSEEKRKEVQDLSIKIYKAMGCEGLARVDFFANKQTGAILFNEINTIPGFTPGSMYAMLMEAVGMPYDALQNRLLELALERGNN